MSCFVYFAKMAQWTHSYSLFKAAGLYLSVCPDSLYRLRWCCVHRFFRNLCSCGDVVSREFIMNKVACGDVLSRGFSGIEFGAVTLPQMVSGGLKGAASTFCQMVSQKTRQRCGLVWTFLRYHVGCGEVGSGGLLGIKSAAMMLRQKISYKSSQVWWLWAKEVSRDSTRKRRCLLQEVSL